MRRGPEMTLQEFLLERNLFEENLLTEILVYFTVVSEMKNLNFILSIRTE